MAPRVEPHPTARRSPSGAPKTVGGFSVFRRAFNLRLRRAVERGYRAYDLMGRDPDLKSLREHPDYRDLVRGR